MGKNRGERVTHRRRDCASRSSCFSSSVIVSAEGDPPPPAYIPSTAPIHPTGGLCLYEIRRNVEGGQVASTTTDNRGSTGVTLPEIGGREEVQRDRVDERQTGLLFTSSSLFGRGPSSASLYFPGDPYRPLFLVILPVKKFYSPRPQKRVRPLEHPFSPRSQDGLPSPCPSNLVFCFLPDPF